MCKMLIDTMDAPTVAAAGAELQLPFLFCGRYGGKPCRVMMDTGATHSILSKEWLDKQNPMLTRHILERPLNLLTANNDTVHIREQFVGPLEIQKSKVGCFAKIMPGMLAGVDLILGADWLSCYDAVLKPKHGVCTLQATNSGKPENLFALRPKHLPGFAAVAEMEKQRCKEAAGVLSAGQTARLLRQGCSSWLMLVQPSDGNDKEGWHTGSLAAAVVGSEGARSAEVNPWLVPAAQLEGLLAEFADVFESMPEGLPPDRKVGHTIRLEPGAVPPYRRMYKLSPREDAEVRKQVAELLAKGLIEPSSSPYGAPILFVQKKDGSLRMCIDYRALNKLTVRDRYPLPRIDELFDKLAGKKVFSSLDLQAGYHQIRITEEDVPKTAFLTPVGQFQFKVLCFGLTNAPATFQRVMNTVFKPLINKSVLVYIDDTLVMSNTPEEHLVHLREAFLGLANYFRRFIPNFSAIAAPLTNLTSKEAAAKYNWAVFAGAELAAFNALKEALCSAPVLALPDFTKAFVVCTDASLLGTGGVLMQEGRPIAYTSKKLSPAETRYTTGEQVLLAIFRAVREWRCYLDGAVDVTIETDHNPLIYLQTQTTLSRRQTRWMEELSRYKYEIKYKPGVHNVADPISRNPALAQQDTPAGCDNISVAVAVLSPWADGLITVMTTRSQAARLHENAEMERVIAREAAYREGKLAPRDLSSARLLPNASPGAPKRTTQHADLAEARLHARPRAQPDGEEDLASARLLPNASPGARSSQADHPPEDLASARLLPPARPGAQPGGGEALQRTTPQPTTSKQGDGKPVSDPLTLLQAIRSAYDDDERFNNEAYTSQLHRLEGLWLTENGKVVVPNSKPLRQRVMRIMHDNQAAGHLGVSKTLDQVTRWFDWAGVSEDVRHYVRNCHSCQVNKASSLKPAGKLRPLPIPLRAWDSVSMDLIVKLPASGPQKYDSILVFVDRLTKMVHLVKTWESITAPQYAKLFIEHVFRLHGMPRDVISDRGPQFKNHFWAEVAKLLRVQVNLSSAYHPQTDGQTERMDRVVEEMLRHYIRPDQKDWAEHLPLVEFAINNARQESTRFTPFYLNYGYHPRRAELLDLPQKVPRALDFVLNIRRAVEQARLCLEKAQKRQKVYADGKRRHATFAPGDMVLLSTQNMRGHSAQPGVRKLKPRYVGPFEVQYMVGEAAVKLELPQQWSRFHNVFHVSLVKPYRSDGSSAVPGVSSPPPEQWLDGEPVYTVERVLDHRLVNTGKRKGKDKKSEPKKPRLEFLVKWQGYGDEHNTLDILDILDYALVCSGDLLTLLTAVASRYTTPTPTHKQARLVYNTSSSANSSSANTSSAGNSSGDDVSNDDGSASSEGWVGSKLAAGVAGCKKSAVGVVGKARAAAGVAGRTRSASGVAGQTGAAARVAGRTKSATGVFALAKAAAWVTARARKFECSEEDAEICRHCKQPQEHHDFIGEVFNSVNSSAWRVVAGPPVPLGPGGGRDDCDCCGCCVAIINILELLGCALALAYSPQLGFCQLIDEVGQLPGDRDREVSHRLPAHHWHVTVANADAKAHADTNAYANLSVKTRTPATNKIQLIPPKTAKKGKAVVATAADRAVEARAGVAAVEGAAVVMVATAAARAVEARAGVKAVEAVEAVVMVVVAAAVVWAAAAVLRATRPADWKPPAGQVEHRLLRPAWSQQRDLPVRGMMWSPVVAPSKPHQAPCSSQAATQLAAPEPQGKATKAKPPPQPGRWVDRDCNAALNMQRIGESRWRPLELCWWPEQGALQAKGKEYPGLGYKRLRDKPPKTQPAVAQ
ncbi:hypothetical protein QJQ45_009191 [Haematococcus lacustris]|nr:hypothetical protein QJQ45_009191 [Haematococcus lacustris]